MWGMSHSQTKPSLPGWLAPAETLAGATAGSFTSWALFRADGIQAETIAWETQSGLDVTRPSDFMLHGCLRAQPSSRTPSMSVWLKSLPLNSSGSRVALASA